MRSRTRSLALAGLCGIVILPTLTSCFLADPEYAINPTTISRDGGDLLIAVCSSAQVTDVWVDARGFPANWETVFHASGTATVGAGEIISTGVPIDGLQTQVGVPIDFDKMTQFGVRLSDQKSDHWLSDAGFELPSSGIPEGKWLHWDGDITEEPCPG